ncbi:MAG: cytochrome c3 family protein [Planctomycetes bacterium]|nr:cytochrome c3 family protein [Planctomycetota bacterium]
MPKHVPLDHHHRQCRTSRATCLLIVATLLAPAGCNSEHDSPTVAEDSYDAPVSAPSGTVGATPTPMAGVESTTQAATGSPPPSDCGATECHEDLFQVAYRHAPVQAGECDSCHQPEQPEHKFPLQRDEVETCTFCHLVIGQKQHLHDVIENDGCLSCHDPHGSNTKFLLTAPSTELTCRDCHDIERKARLHGPFASGECTACHEPHESDNSFLLRGGAGRDHCLLCHQVKGEQLRTAKTVHQPLEEGCTGCHEVHSSDYAGLLAEPIEELCFGCHDEIEEKVTEAATSHGAVVSGQRCANCHDPHAGDRQYLLSYELQAQCLSCHAEPQIAPDGRTIPDMRPVLSERKSLHGPVRTGQCNACHDAHGSPNARLLRWQYPPGFYAAFDLAKYALCFECHNSSAFLSERTETDTDFRDGDRNLHYLHVNRAEKGRTCQTCHEIHGSDLPRHMASAVPFEGGGWAMPIGFRQTETGGRCSPGCHEPEEYRRRPRPLTPAPAGKLND